MQRNIVIYGISLLLASCATTLDQDRLTFMGERASAPEKQKPVILASDDAAQCEEIAHKRITYGLFSLPFNELKSSDVPENQYGAYRFRTEVRPLDVLYTTLGFLFTVTTKTIAVEGCKTDYAVVEESRLKQVSELEKTVSDSPVPVMLLPDSASENGVDPVTVYFSFNGQELDAASVDKVSRIVQLYRGAGEEAKLLLVGHSDSRGGEIPNLNVAFQRAIQVREALKREGIPEGRILVSSASDSWNQRSGEAEEKQRRVDVIVLKKIHQDRTAESEETGESGGPVESGTFEP